MSITFKPLDDANIVSRIRHTIRLAAQVFSRVRGRQPADVYGLPRDALLVCVTALDWTA